MKALVYEGPGKITLADKPKPVLQAPGDAVVRVTLTTICGTDLHSIKGARWATKAWGVESVGAAFRNAAKTQALKVIIAA